MKPTIVYIYPANAGPKHTELAVRFIQSYKRFPPATDHNTVIVLNGAKRDSVFEALFSSLSGVQFLERDDSGWDIGGYQDAARNFPSDLMVFMGGSTYFRGPAWLVRIISVVNRFGEGLYGSTANRGDARVNVSPHIRTTGFWTSARLMNEYPWRVTSQEQRYPFEHGPHCFTTWVKQKGKTPRLVTWGGVYEWAQWDSPVNGFHRGNQSDVIFGDRLTEPPFYPFA